LKEQKVIKKHAHLYAKYFSQKMASTPLCALNIERLKRFSKTQTTNENEIKMPAHHPKGWWAGMGGVSPLI